MTARVMGRCGQASVRLGGLPIGLAFEVLAMAPGAVLFVQRSTRSDLGRLLTTTGNFPGQHAYEAQK